MGDGPACGEGPGGTHSNSVELLILLWLRPPNVCGTVKEIEAEEGSGEGVATGLPVEAPATLSFSIIVIIRLGAAGVSAEEEKGKEGATPKGHPDTGAEADNAPT